MARETIVAGVVGSLRANSTTRIVVRHALSAAGAAGAETDLIDLRNLDLPVYDPGASDAGDGEELRQRIERADAVILGTPMYHGSYSSAIKNAMDYCGFDEFEHTTVGLCGVAGGSFPISALEHLRTVCRAVNAWVLPHQAAVPNSRRRFEDGEFVDEDYADRVDVLGERIVEYAHIDQVPDCFESEQNVGAGR